MFVGSPLVLLGSSTFTKIDGHELIIVAFTYIGSPIQAQICCHVANITSQKSSNNGIFSSK
jgi:hypothetical protein